MGLGATDGPVAGLNLDCPTTNQLGCRPEVRGGWRGVAHDFACHRAQLESIRTHGTSDSIHRALHYLGIDPGTGSRQVLRQLVSVLLISQIVGDDRHGRGTPLGRNGCRPSAVIEVAFETTRTFTDMLYACVFRRFPDVTFEVAHCGAGTALGAVHLGLLYERNLQSLLDFDGLTANEKTAIGSNASRLFPAAASRLAYAKRSMPNSKRRQYPPVPRRANGSVGLTEHDPCGLVTRQCPKTRANSVDTSASIGHRNGLTWTYWTP